MSLPVALFDDIFLSSNIFYDPSTLKSLLRSMPRGSCVLDAETSRLTFCPSKKKLHIFSNTDSKYLGNISYIIENQLPDSTLVISLSYDQLVENVDENDLLVNLSVFMLLSLLYNDQKTSILACEDSQSVRTAINLLEIGLLSGDVSERAFYFDGSTPTPSLYMKLPIENGSKAYTNYNHALLSAMEPYLDNFYINSDGFQIEMEAITPDALERLVEMCPPIEIARLDSKGFSKTHNGVYINLSGSNACVLERFLIDNPIKELCYQGVVIFNALEDKEELRANPKYPYIEALFGYMGSKRRLLNQMLPLLPENINTFVDMFCGAANVGINVKAKKIILNDANPKLISLYKMVKTTPPELIAKRAFELCQNFGLNDKKTRKQGYYRLRDYINSQKDKESKEFYMTLYLLICISFFYIFDFKEDGTFVGTAGTSTYSENRKKKLIAFSDRLKDKQSPVVITNYPFQRFDFASLTKKDFLYADPPYLITDAEYNKYWGEHDEIKLYEKLDDLHKRGIRFALSNTMALKNKVNDILVDWVLRNEGKYIPIKLDIKYTTSMWNRKEYQSEVNAEVFVTNYQPPSSDYKVWTRKELTEMLRGRSLLAIKYLNK